MDAYTTKAILGGITIATELDVAIKAVENGAEKPPCSTIAGIRTAPRAATVAGPEPEIAPKKQETITHTIAMPPFCVRHRYLQNRSVCVKFRLLP